MWQNIFLTPVAPQIAQTMLNWQTDAFSARQASSNHLPFALLERIAQFWLRPPSGWWVISDSQFLKRMVELVWSIHSPSFKMSLIPNQICSSGPMVWRTYAYNWSFSSPERGLLSVPPFAMQSSFAVWKFFFIGSARKHLPGILVPFRQTEKERVKKEIETKIKQINTKQHFAQNWH